MVPLLSTPTETAWPGLMIQKEWRMQAEKLLWHTHTIIFVTLMTYLQFLLFHITTQQEATEGIQHCRWIWLLQQCVKPKINRSANSARICGKAIVCSLVERWEEPLASLSPAARQLPGFRTEKQVKLPLPYRGWSSALNPVRVSQQLRVKWLSTKTGRFLGTQD